MATCSKCKGTGKSEPQPIDRDPQTGLTRYATFGECSRCKGSGIDPDSKDKPASPNLASGRGCAIFPLIGLIIIFGVVGYIWNNIKPTTFEQNSPYLGTWQGKGNGELYKGSSTFDVIVFIEKDKTTIQLQQAGNSCKFTTDFKEKRDDGYIFKEAHNIETRGETCPTFAYGAFEIALKLDGSNQLDWQLADKSFTAQNGSATLKKTS